jgi:hypothetical protein
MNLIQCNCSCIYQDEGYCKLEKAAEITNQSSNYDNGCLHFVEKKNKYNGSSNSEQPNMPL